MVINSNSFKIIMSIKRNLKIADKQPITKENNYNIVEHSTQVRIVYET